jgi:hypothetical protein
MLLLRATLRAARRGAAPATAAHPARRCAAAGCSLATETTSTSSTTTSESKIDDVSSSEVGGGGGAGVSRDGRAGARAAADDVEANDATRQLSSSSSSSSSSPSPTSTSSPSSPSLYPGHQPLTAPQSALLTVVAGLGALVFPQRADLVGAMVGLYNESCTS